MSKVEVNTIEPQCGTTLTLGGSGDTVALGSGASQTGFGRTGTVDWQTGSIKTTTFTAANGEGYFANTSGGAFTMNLPAGSAGNIVSVVDYTNTFQNNALTVAPNGSEKIGGVNATTVLSTEGQSVTFVYVDGTEGWKNVQDSTSNVVGATFICASVSGACNTLATAPDCANMKIATFTGPGNFTVNSISNDATNNIVSHVVVAGGGGGGSNYAGGGGAGGYREVVSPSSPYSGSPLDGYPSAPNRVTVTAQAYPIVIGGGGAAGSSDSEGSNGVDSTFSTITATAGGGGGSVPSPAANLQGNPGGSGGGNANDSAPYGNPSGNTPPVSPPQGNDGGRGRQGGSNGSGGGGGATAVGADGFPGGGSPTGGGAAGGAGATSSITGSAVARAGGGGGGGQNTAPGGAGGTGGGGPGSGCASSPGSTPGTAGTVNTGGGGGGATCGTNTGGTGGSGIVIIRYRFQ
jgi:hypothetical protein